jgi:hypothetical protein
VNCQELIQSSNLTTEAGINEALTAASVSDGLLYEVLRALRYRGGLTRQIAIEAFSSICYFYDNSSDKRMARYATLKIRELEGGVFKQKLMEEFSDVLAGVELSNGDKTQFAVFLPDSSEPGRYRYSLFDKYGFYNHYTFDTYKEALDSAWDEGFRHRASGSLNNLCVQSSWHAGTKITNAIQKLNSGKIGYSEYLAEVA